MYKVNISCNNESIPKNLDVINEERGIIRFVNVDKYAMYIIYEVPDYGSDV